MEKLNNISLLRLVAVILIFTSHILLFVISSDISDKFFPFYFGVNIFLFISAFLYSNKNIDSAKTFYKKQFLKILVPPLIFVLFVFAVELIVCPQAFASIDAYNPIANLWYIGAIFVCYLIIPVLSSLKNGNYKKLKIFALIMVLILEFVLTIFLRLQFAILTFVISYFIAGKMKTSKKSKVLPIIMGVVFLLATGLYFYFGYFVGANLTGILFMLVESLKHFLCLVMGIFFSIFFLWAFEFLNKADAGKFFYYTDKYSFCFYIVQQSLMVGIFSVLNLTDIKLLNVFFVFLFSIIFSVVLQTLSDKVIYKIKEKKN